MKWKSVERHIQVLRTEAGSACVVITAEGTLETVGIAVSECLRVATTVTAGVKEAKAWCETAAAELEAIDRDLAEKEAAVYGKRVT